MARILIWYRNDLRLHDHAPLHTALSENAQVIGLYCFDPRQFGEMHWGFAKTGPFRARFLIESVADLRRRWQLAGSNLVVRLGKPETVIATLCQSLAIDAVYCSQEVTSEELAVDAAVQAHGVRLQRLWQATLYHPDDLPFAIAQVPSLFTQFRKAVESEATLRPSYPAPATLPTPPPDVSWGDLPSLGQLGLQAPLADWRVLNHFVGGETAGLARLHDYIWERDRLRLYKDTRNGMLQPDDSTKVSPWLALGCLSPRAIAEEVARYETTRIRNDSTYWLMFELLWRDYFRFIAAQAGHRLFRRQGLQGLEIRWQHDWDLFSAWQQGETGYPLIDACMQELAVTGFMSNRGRQNVASFLTKNLGINWQIGAAWFESLLIDYDVCSNWGNWNYAAGVGNDARGFRYFNIPKQARDYDPEGTYVKHWLPVLANMPAAKVHEPHRLLPIEQERYCVIAGRNYPEPIVNLAQSVKENEAIYMAALEQQQGRKNRRNSKRDPSRRSEQRY